MTDTIFEKSKNKIDGIRLSDNDNDFKYIDEKFLRKNDVNLPQMPEIEVMRHFKELSDKNFCIESGFYPLGSCTMKYNPKINEKMARLEGFCNIHPLCDDDDNQGTLKLLYNLQEFLKEITGMAAITLQPAAGAHGELCGMTIVKKYFQTIKEQRTKVIVPDSAHGTNPASAAMCGFEIIEVKSKENGQVDIDALKELVTPDVAAIMLTNPNTLGLFEENILQISEIMHKNGSLLYYDGANSNAILGHTNPYKMGFDIVHLNMHKTFSTPHGGGGPGAGPVGVVEKLKEFLPVPIYEFDGKHYQKKADLRHSIGQMKAFYGNISVLLRAYTYILMLGRDLKKVSEDAVLNANYIQEKLKKYFCLPHDTHCMHEFVLCGEDKKEKGVSTLLIAKKLMDMGYHPPTVYFPLIVHEALMIEPTESETKETLDNFIDAMIKISQEIDTDAQSFQELPINTPIKRVDETLAARHPDLKETTV